MLERESNHHTDESMYPKFKKTEYSVKNGMTTSQKSGFTLVELAIVLVIIGLLVGGVLVGNDLIKSSQIRSQISQIDKYQITVNTFKLKYNCLPGDCSNATNYGFSGNGNGDNSLAEAYDFTTGENNYFWLHLSQANLIEGSYLISGSNTDTNVSGKISDYIPPAKLGGNLYVYVKKDDGLPQTGSTQALFIECQGRTVWANGDSYCAGGTGKTGLTNTIATPASSTNCYDNNNIAGATQQYSVGTNGGNGLNCALSIKFQ